MTVAALQHLTPAHPRQFVPAGANLADWAQVEPLFAKLQAALQTVRSARALAHWVETASELGAALDQEGSTRYINMTCQTDDPAAEMAFLHFIEQIEPKTKPHWHKLNELFLANPYYAKLPPKRWLVFNRSVKNDVELFRQENVPLQVEESKLAQQYQKLMGAMAVNFQGREQTLQQMSKYLEEPDRELRAQAWRLVAERRLQDRAAIERIYDQLLGLRARIAAQAGLPSYREYAFKAYGRFDYTPADCEAFHQAVAETVVPLARALQTRRRELLRADILRPWDLSVDVKNRPPLKPFANAAELAEKCRRIFNRIDPVLAVNYSVMQERKLLDLDSRKGKAPGGYQSTLEEARLPFIFMNAVGLQRDVETMLHEAGHAFHSLATRDEPLLSYRRPPLEFAEVASMSMELLGAPHLDEFYAPADVVRARRVHLEGIIQLLPWIAVIDAFQHWIYTHPGHTPANRENIWLGLLDRFGGTESYQGFEAVRACLWHRQGHLFGSPFYYIEYGIAQLGALQVWLKARKNAAAAVAHYRKALALGGSRPLPELFKTAGLKFDFGPKAVAPLVKAVERELATLKED